LRISVARQAQVDETRPVPRPARRSVFHMVLHADMQRVNDTKPCVVHTSGTGGAKGLR